jgi:hypothetical protein
LFSNKIKFVITGLLNISNCYWSLIEDCNLDDISHFNFNIDNGGLLLCNKMIINGKNKKNINFRLTNGDAVYENMVLIFVIMLVDII